MAKAIKNEETKSEESVQIVTPTENTGESKTEPKQAEFDPVVEVEKLIREVLKNDSHKVQELVGKVINRIDQFRGDKSKMEVSKMETIASYIVTDLFKVLK